jgi:hypothetical protein
MEIAFPVAASMGIFENLRWKKLHFEKSSMKNF